MTHTTVDSSTFIVIGYDPCHEALELEFRDRTRYRYLDVPSEVHAALLSAHSKGNYFNQFIRGRYCHVKKEPLS